jgi:hypothetical protein
VVPRCEEGRRYCGKSLALAAAMFCAACVPSAQYGNAQYGTANLPAGVVVGAGDPLRSAILSTASAFASPGLTAPAAARAVAQMEFLAVNLPQNPSSRSSPATLEPQLMIARQEWRAALGIAPDAPAQAVINGLYAAGSALDEGQNEVALAILSRAPFQRGGPATLAVLTSLPRLPSTAAAAATGLQTLVEPSPSGRRRF